MLQRCGQDYFVGAAAGAYYSRICTLARGTRCYQATKRTKRLAIQHQSHWIGTEFNELLWVTLFTHGDAGWGFWLAVR